MSEPTLRLLPLGGLGEIGKNMMVVELDGRIVIVDTGLMFPTAEMLGIDLVLPDFSYLRGRLDDIEAIVLTHGHEDHVGALPYVLKEIGVPPAIYGGRLTVGLVRSKLEEHKLKDVPIEEIEAGERREAGPFEIVLQIRPSNKVGRFDLQGQVASDGEPIPKGAHVVVTSEQGHVDRTSVDAHGEFRFIAVPEGLCRLVWFGDGARIELDELAVGEQDGVDRD